MKLKLYKVDNEYAFSVDNFSSLHHAFLSPSLNPTYAYAWRAYRDAIRLSKTAHIKAMDGKRYAYEDLTKPMAEDASAEEMLLDHYSSILDIIYDKSEGNNKTEEKKIIYEEIKVIVSEILKVKEQIENEADKGRLGNIISKFKQIVSEHYSDLLSKDIKEEGEEAAMPEVPAIPELPAQPEGQPPAQPPAQPPTIQAKAINRIQKFSNMEFENNVIEDTEWEGMINEYAERICSAIEKRHPSAIYKTSGLDINIVESKNGKVIIKARVNKNMNLENIIPSGELAEIFPLSSTEFYQRYFKPIVESVGHFYVKEANCIIASNKAYLPDIPKDCPKSFSFKSWDAKNKKEGTITLSFFGKDPTWSFEKSAVIKEASASSISPDTKYTEEDFLTGTPKRVMCTAPELKSIYGKIGEVVQVIPLETHLELDVNFGRQIIRLTGSQIKIV